MRLNRNFIAHDDGSEKLLVSAGGSDFSGLVRGNSTAGFIMECLENDNTEAEIAERMKEKYDAPAEAIERDLKRVLAQLREIGAIDD